MDIVKTTHSCEYNLILMLREEFLFPAIDLHTESEWFELHPAPDSITRRDGGPMNAHRRELIFDLYSSAYDTLKLGRCLDPRQYYCQRARRIQEWSDTCGMLQQEMRMPEKQVYGVQSHEAALWAACSIKGTLPFKHVVTKEQLSAWNEWMTICKMKGNLLSYLDSFDKLEKSGDTSAWYPGGISQLVFNECRNYVYDWKILMEFACCQLQDLPFLIACHGELYSESKQLVALRLEGCDMGFTQPNKEESHD